MPPKTAKRLAESDVSDEEPKPKKRAPPKTAMSVGICTCLTKKDFGDSIRDCLRSSGEIFGVSKIKNGNRYATVSLASMVVILYPGEKKAQAWITV
ncbi:hypothetical protein F4804DRAFT_338205 [Jackrogersella minutella]|nr:hypothetical protein F4804DRAFT_338205 [Jackrogersella minutella]